MRLMYARLAGTDVGEVVSVETTLWFAMQHVWNWHAFQDNDTIYVRAWHGQKNYVESLVAWALGNLERARTHQPHHSRDMLLWPFHPFMRPRGWTSMESADRGYWLDEEWPRMLRRELLGDGLESGRGRLRLDEEDFKWKCERWFLRARAARTARNLRAQALIPAVLEGAALLLAGCVGNNRDALDRVLQHAAAALWTENGFDPRTRLPLVCI
jgi:hypothetical protein